MANETQTQLITPQVQGQTDSVTGLTLVPAIAPQSLVQTPTQAPVVQVTQVPPVVETQPQTVVAPLVTPEGNTVLSEAFNKPIVADGQKSVEGEVTPPEKVEVKKENDGGQSEKPAPLPVYDAFKVPEGVSLDPERIKGFTDILAEFESKTKADHLMSQEFGQKAVDFHLAEVQKATQVVQDTYKTAWDNQRKEWRDNFLKDPDIGGNRFQTTVDAAKDFIRTHGGTAEQQKEFITLMETSGLGNHRAMIRILAHAGRAMQEGKPLAAQKAVSPTKSKTATLYGSL